MENKETLEEFKKRFANDESHKNIKLDYQDGIYYGIEVGTKWQAERMYSEEETYRILHKLMMEIYIDGLLIADDTDLKMWFQQNKKKQ